MPLKPLPYREVKRKLEAVGFTEVSQKEAMSNLLETRAKVFTQPSCPIIYTVKITNK